MALFKIGETIKYRGDIYKIMDISDFGYDVFPIEFTDAEEVRSAIGFNAEDRMERYEMPKYVTIPVEIVENIIRYCEDKQIYDKLGTYGDFYYKLKKAWRKSDVARDLQ